MSDCIDALVGKSYTFPLKFGHNDLIPPDVVKKSADNIFLDRSNRFMAVVYNRHVQDPLQTEPKGNQQYDLLVLRRAYKW